jgi:hypothetical protein
LADITLKEATSRLEVLAGERKPLTIAEALAQQARQRQAGA